MPSPTDANGAPVQVTPRRERRFLKITTPPDGEADEFEATISTTTPVERGWCLEVLSHTAEAVDMGRAGNGLPLLLDHDPTKQIGRVLNLRIEGERLRGRLRFGNGQAARDILQDVREGIRQELSVGYEILEQRSGKGREVVVTRWTPLEVSIVAIPADPFAGIGRSMDFPPMTTNTTPAGGTPELGAPSAVVTREYAHREAVRREIMDLAELASMREAGIIAVARGHSVEQFRAEVLAARASKPLGAAPDPLQQEVAERYSLLRAVRALIDPRAQREASFEIEVSQELQRRTGKRSSGLMVPTDLPMRGTRAMTFGGTGSNMVQTDVLNASFIDVLRARLYAVQAGATVLDGLEGNVAIPRKASATTAYWIAGDDGDSITGSDAALNQVTLSPKLMGALTTISHRMLVQTSGGVEQMLRDDLAKTLAAELDRVALAGSGASNQPRGVLNTSGITAATFGTGTTPTYAQVLAMETAVDASGMEHRAYITSPTMRARFKAAEIIASSGRMVWETPERGMPGEGRMNGYQAWATTNLGAQEMLFGNWSDLVLGLWGAMSIEADPGGTNFAKGSISLRALLDVDVAVRYASSFAKLTGV